MSKNYFYRDLSYTAGKDETLTFTVEMVSDGNTAKTTINLPGPNDPEIMNSGSAELGRTSDVAGHTMIYSAVNNPIPEEDQIIIRYSINGKLLVEHTNPKSEEDRPNIFLLLNIISA